MYKNMNLIVALFILCIAGCSTSFAKELCHTDCTTPYGMVLGVSSGEVKAYSNCQASCMINEAARVDGIYTGVKWQCVEFARRWLLLNKGAVYDDVETAADIWTEIDHLTHVASNKKLKLESHLNGAVQPPRVGDLLIYARVFHNTGHIAVVTGVDQKKGIIEVGEQNYNNEMWPDDHARTIEFVEKSGNYWLLDRYLIGWKHIIN